MALSTKSSLLRRINRERICVGVPRATSLGYSIFRPIAALFSIFSSLTGSSLGFSGVETGFSGSIAAISSIISAGSVLVAPTLPIEASGVPCNNPSRVGCMIACGPPVRASKPISTPIAAGSVISPSDTSCAEASPAPPKPACAITSAPRPALPNCRSLPAIPKETASNIAMGTPRSKPFSFNLGPISGSVTTASI